MTSYEKEITTLLNKIILDDDLHAKWLNTLSYLENCGARKIAACEHSTLVKEEMLKHASEEFRHAHYLKKQIERVTNKNYPTYALDSLLGSFATLNYLNMLDAKTSRYLTNRIEKSELKKVSYLLVTYAIEVRAEELYPIYEKLLREKKSKVTVKSILLEEKEHLEEMRKGIEELELEEERDYVLALESTLADVWLKAIRTD